ncbi:phytanoyl-CoA dioxygenase family protein [Tateyamaria sp. SN6-1]|uniref:phytanoyl-CoA dioxygenase family protein n=1 Tax=Tateyamaria sp. SN6-1 TaxID=3092148 RepID=UPI0039F4F060
MKDRIEPQPGYFDVAQCDIAEFNALIARETSPDMCPRAARIEAKVPIYDMGALRGDLNDHDSRRALMAEWAAVLNTGPGVVVLKHAYSDTRVLDEAAALFDEIIAEERASKGEAADHFAASGANDRIWNVQEKLCLRAPDLFVRYFANATLDAISEAWLGRGYQMTSQVNLVRPGGAAQEAHRDYHLGFMTAEEAAAFPVHMHLLSPLLTLQGAIAHCDMSVESGPTQLLPYSQLYPAGYVSFRQPEFRAAFDANAVQVPLEKGDTLFFNPALFHAAGANRTPDIHRLANLLQVSSPMGRSLEKLDRLAMAKAVYPHLGQVSGLEQEAAIAAAAEGYPFPTNLDTDPPVGGLAPESDQALLRRGVAEGMSADDVNAALDRAAAKRG